MIGFLYIALGLILIIFGIRSSYKMLPPWNQVKQGDSGSSNGPIQIKPPDDKPFVIF